MSSATHPTGKDSSELDQNGEALKRRVNDNQARLDRFRSLYGELDTTRPPPPKPTRKPGRPFSKKRGRSADSLTSSGDGSTFNPDLALQIFDSPSYYKDHMRIIIDHMDNFETGTAGPTNLKLAAELGSSMAFMNAALDAHPTPSLLPDETHSSARAAVKSALPRFKAAMDHIGEQPGNVRKRKAFNCLRLLYDKLSRFAVAQPYSGIKRHGKKSVKYQSDHIAIERLIREPMEASTCHVTLEEAEGVVDRLVDAFELPRNLMADAEETLRRAYGYRSDGNYRAAVERILGKWGSTEPRLRNRFKASLMDSPQRIIRLAMRY